MFKDFNEEIYLKISNMKKNNLIELKNELINETNKMQYEINNLNSLKSNLKEIKKQIKFSKKNLTLDKKNVRKREKEINIETNFLNQLNISYFINNDDVIDEKEYTYTKKR